MGLHGYSRYVLIFARSQTQTLHELRMVAEEKLATALQDARRANSETVFRLLRAGHAPKPNTFESGVKAALGAMRELDHANAVLSAGD